MDLTPDLMFLGPKQEEKEEKNNYSAYLPHVPSPWPWPQRLKQQKINSCQFQACRRVAANLPQNGRKFLQGKTKPCTMGLTTSPQGTVAKALYGQRFPLPNFINLEFKVSLVGSGQRQGTRSITTEKVGHRGSMDGFWKGQTGLEKSWVGL